MSKLLLVEDDNNLREIYEARLQAEGYTIVTAKDGEEALAVAKAEKPDLIVSDVMMPKISGFEMLDILKNTDGLKNVKVIMLTALGQSDDQQRADTLGADRYLVKSQVTLEDIVRVAHELLEDGAPAPATAAPAATPAPAVAPEPVNPVAAAPAVAPEPTQVTAAPEPVAAPPVAAEPPTTTTPDPATAATTTATPEPVAASDAASTSASEAKSTSEESANLKDQIEDIIEGATTDAPAPVEPAAATPEPVATPDQTTAADNEKVMNDAVNSLTSTAAPVEPAAATPEPATATPTEAPAAAPAAKPVGSMVAPAAEEDKSDVPGSASGGSTMSHEKVIQPPADSQVEKKPDIQALFAAEQAKEAANQVGGVVQPQTPATPTDGTEKPVDPNSIAL